MADLIQDENSFFVDLCACGRALGHVRVRRPCVQQPSKPYKHQGYFLLYFYHKSLLMHYTISADMFTTETCTSEQAH